jgi:hypothetical protein
MISFFKSFYQYLKDFMTHALYQKGKTYYHAGQTEEGGLGIFYIDPKPLHRVKSFLQLGAAYPLTATVKIEENDLNLQDAEIMRKYMEDAVASLIATAAVKSEPLYASVVGKPSFQIKTSQGDFPYFGEEKEVVISADFQPVFLKKFLREDLERKEAVTV